MSRFLTPAKVILLVLTVLYTENAVPTSETKSFLAFLLDQILPDGRGSLLTSDPEFEPAVPISVFESVLSKHASIRPGRSLYDLLLKRLWLIHCSDALDLFITNLPSLLSKPREVILRERETGEESELPYGNIRRTSPLGAFIRRCHLEYTRLQFQDSISLWQEFLLYRAPSRQAYEKKNPSDTRTPLDSNLNEYGIDTSHPLTQMMYSRLTEWEDQTHTKFSTYDVEKLLEFQVSEMQRLGGRLPSSIRTSLGAMSRAGTSTPKLAHYLTFLDAWRAGDYTSAFDNLHRYFDYTMQSRDRTFYQYALLNLAILQADFGCHAEAIPAMREAIATARENKDTVCLNFCMSWLYHFGRSFPAQMASIRESGILGSETEGLAFLKSRAKDAEMWSLLSTSLLSEAKLGLQYGDSIALVFENIAKAAHLSIVKSANNVTGPALLMKAAAFSRIGLTHLTWSCGETFMQCHADEAPMEDVLKCRCRMASLLTQRGRYLEAEEMMATIPPELLRVLKFQNYSTFYSGLLSIRKFLHRDDLDAAEHLIEKLKGQGAPDVEIGYSLSLLRVDLLMRRGILDEALELVEDLAQKAQVENNDVVVLTRLMNVKARILAETGHALKGFSVVVRSAQMAYRARVLPSLWESIGSLANILNILGEFAASTELMQAIVPQALECQDCDLAARSYSLLADASMGLAGKESDNSTKQKEHINKAMDSINTAYTQYRYLEDLRGQLDMLQKKATIMHWRGDLTLANDTASQYLEIEKEYRALKV